jgi:hypothetical protein
MGRDTAIRESPMAAADHSRRDRIFEHLFSIADGFTVTIAPYLFQARG